jgi:hypothetical protein
MVIVPNSGWGANGRGVWQANALGYRLAANGAFF